MLCENRVICVFIIVSRQVIAINKFLEVKQIPMLMTRVQISELIKSPQQLLSLIRNIIKVSFRTEHSIKLLIIHFHILVVLFYYPSHFLTNPLELLYAYAEPVHLLQDLCQLLVLVEEHLLYLFLKQFLFHYLACGL